MLRGVGLRGNRQLRRRLVLITSAAAVRNSQTEHGPPGFEPALPYADASPDANIEAVSCAAGGGCTAVADYTDLAGNQLAGAVNGTLAAAAEPILSLERVAGDLRSRGRATSRRLLS